MSVTIKDVAREAGVSYASVSRILSNKGRFSEATAQRVRKVAAELGYFKNKAASDLSSNAPRVIGVVMPQSRTNFADSLMQGIYDASKADGFDIIISYMGGDDDKAQSAAIENLVSRNIAGILLLSIQLKVEHVKRLQHSKLPFISVSVTLPYDIATVTSDDFDLGYQACQFLIAQGHRRIALVGPQVNDQTVGTQRLKGYQQALAEHQISFDEALVFPGAFDYESGERLLQRETILERFTAVIAASDMVALGVMNAAKDQGISIPEQLSLISIDGTNLTQLTRPRITAIQQDFHQMGEVATKMIIQNIMANQPLYTTRIANHLLMGQTVAKI